MPKTITVRLMGDPGGVAAAVDGARLAQAQRELDKYSAEDRQRIVAMLNRRYGG